MKLDQKTIKSLIIKWKKILKIDPQWRITFNICDSPLAMSEDCQDAMASISIDLKYFSANIEFNSLDIDEEDLDYIVLHELLHIIIEPIALSSACGLGKKYEEMALVLCESTIEKLIPGYLTLNNKKNKVLIGKKNRKNICSSKFPKSHKN